MTRALKANRHTWPGSAGAAPSVRGGTLIVRAERRVAPEERNRTLRDREAMRAKPTNGPDRLGRYRFAMAAPRPTNGFVSTWQTVQGLRWHTREPEATAAAPIPVVLLHGLAVSHRYLMPTGAALLSRGWDVRVPDLPGFGLTDGLRAVLDVRAQADSLLAWLEAKELNLPVLLGNSFGCQIAVDIAARQPQRVRALVLSGPTMDVVGRTAPRQLMRWGLDLLREDPLQLPMMLRDIRDATPARVFKTLRHAVADPIERKLPHVTVPTLVLRGGREPIVPRRWAEHVCTLLPQGELLEIPGKPHNCVYVAPDALAEATSEFLRRTLQAG
jgi:pimeloyl-ACP methyl ester carboxylesterase